MNTKMALIAIFVSAVITFGLRSLPFLVFQEGKELPDQIKRLGMVAIFDHGSTDRVLPERCRG